MKDEDHEAYGAMIHRGKVEAMVEWGARGDHAKPDIVETLRAYLAGDHTVVMSIRQVTDVIEEIEKTRADRARALELLQEAREVYIEDPFCRIIHRIDALLKA